MTRVLLLLAVAIGVILWWKHSQRGRRGDASPPAAPPPPTPPTTPTTPTGPEAMLRCAQCGLHLPSSQTLPGRGGVFCSAAHREQFEARS